MTTSSQQGRRVVITGGAGGIGLEAARGLAQAGAEVLIIDKREGAGHEAARTPNISFRRVDLSRMGEVRAFADDELRQGRPIDLLINNAGIQPLTTRLTTAEGFELTFGIGFVAHYALTAKLLPLLLAARAPRVVTVSSIMHAVGTIDWSDVQLDRRYGAQRAYNQTKLACLLFAVELQRRATQAGVALTSLAAHPGMARTGIGPNRADLGALGPLDRFTGGLISFATGTLGQSAADGAQALLYAATSDAVEAGGFYGPTGWLGARGPVGPVLVRGRGADPDEAQRLWALGEALTGARFEFSRQP